VHLTNLEHHSCAHWISYIPPGSPSDDWRAQATAIDWLGWLEAVYLMCEESLIPSAVSALGQFADRHAAQVSSLAQAFCISSLSTSAQFHSHSVYTRQTNIYPTSLP
jgi:hypothetical protein